MARKAVHSVQDILFPLPPPEAGKIRLACKTKETAGRALRLTLSPTS